MASLAAGSMINWRRGADGSRWLAPGLERRRV